MAAVPVVTPPRDQTPSETELVWPIGGTSTCRGAGPGDPLMSDKAIGAYDVVTIAHSDETQALEIAGEEGLVLGLSVDEISGEQWFAVQVRDLPLVMVSAADLSPTAAQSLATRSTGAIACKCAKTGRCFVAQLR